MILSKEVGINITNRNITYFKDKGYTNIKSGDVINVNVNDINRYSRVKITIKCTNCSGEKDMVYQKYMDNVERQGFYTCKKCSYIKKENTWLDNYGVSNPMKSKDIQEKGKQTKLDKYGDENYNNNDKHTQTNIERYGVEHHLQNKDIYDKLKKTCISKYGVDHPTKSIEVQKRMSDNSKITKLKLSIKTYKENHNIDIIDKTDNYLTIHCDECNDNYIIKDKLLQLRIYHNTKRCTNCNPIGFGNTSQQEKIICDFIREYYNGEIITNSKKIIAPYEIDIYLPEFKLAIEYNGVYWHNELNKPDDYHKNKTVLCDDINIQLLHVYEDDWLLKQDIVKSMILNKLKLTAHRVYARKCEIKLIKDNKMVKSFLIDNHIQGYSNSSIKIGLFYNGELVSLMTFGKVRKIMNMKSNGNEYELIRFCNKLNHTIIGSASKLFKYFITNFNFDNIITYADRGYSNGNLYDILGFTFIKETKPSYYYVINNSRVHRFNYRKSKLVKDGFDADKTEHQIMFERKYYRIYNSGNYRYNYKKKG